MKNWQDGISHSLQNAEAIGEVKAAEKSTKPHKTTDSTNLRKKLAKSAIFIF